MKGNPILRLSLVLLLLAAVLVPVCRLALTSGKIPVGNLPEIHPGEASPTPSQIHGRLLLHVAPAPLRCHVTLRGKPLLSEKDRIASGEYSSDAVVAPGDDLVIAAEWSDENPHAVRVEFLPSGMTTPVNRTFWAKRMLEDVLTIPASPANKNSSGR